MPITILPGSPSDSLRTYNVRQYGARGDGATDDTGPIQAAITAAGAVGGVVYFPTPTVSYQISAALSIKYAGLRLLGSSMERCVIVQQTYATPVFDIFDTNNPSTQFAGVTVDGFNLQFNGTRTNPGGLPTVRGDNQYALGCGVYTASPRTVVRNCTLHGFTVGVYLHGWNGSNVVTGRAANCLVEHILVDTVDWGVLVAGHDYLTIRGLHGSYVSSAGPSNGPAHLLYVTNTGDNVYTRYATIDDCYAYDSTAAFAYMLKWLQSSQIGKLAGHNTGGLISLLNASDNIFGELIADADAGTSGVGTINFQNSGESNNQILSARIVKTTSDRAVSMGGTQNTLRNLSLQTHRIDVLNDSDITVVGTRNRVTNVRAVNDDADPPQYGNRTVSVTAGSGHRISDVSARGVVYLVAVGAGVTGTLVDVDPAATQYAGSLGVGVGRILLDSGSGTIFRRAGATLAMSATSGVWTPSNVFDASLYDYFQITVNDNNAGAGYSPAAPINGWVGAQVTYDIFNNSGGAIVINPASSLQLSEGIAYPAAGKHFRLTVQFDGTTWHEVSRTSHTVASPAGTPTSIVAGTGAGTGPTATIAGSDITGVVTLVTGTTPAASATVFTVTFSSAYGFSQPKGVFLEPAEANAAALTGTGRVYADVTSLSTTAWVAKVGTSALAASTTYKWYYRVLAG